MIEGIFLARKNRRLAEVEVEGECWEAYVSNGAEMDFLKRGSVCYLQEIDNPNRKTAFNLFSVYDQDTLVCVDAKAPLYTAGDWYIKRLQKELNTTEKVAYLDYPTSLHLEMFVGRELSTTIQVMGTSLVKDRRAYLPEMRSSALNKRLENLRWRKNRGQEVRLLFATCRNDVESFFVNEKADTEFADLLKFLQVEDIPIECLRCLTDEEGLKADQLIPVEI
ncbi:MAG: DNA/RNA nuclease SfsA [Clostridia bacterium]|nr:DNA/RNA nuclease SfsA [Clostridia bacterium]